MSCTISVLCVSLASSCASHSSALGMDNIPFNDVLFGRTFELPHTNEKCICPFEVLVLRYMA